MNGDDASEEILKTVGLPLVNPVPAVDDTHPDDTKIKSMRMILFFRGKCSVITLLCRHKQTNTGKTKLSCTYDIIVHQ